MFKLSSSGLWRLSGWLLFCSDHWRRADCATHRRLHRHHSQKGNMPWPISLLNFNKSCEAWRHIFNFTYFWTHHQKGMHSGYKSYIYTQNWKLAVIRQLLGISHIGFCTSWHITRLIQRVLLRKKIVTGFDKVIHVYCIKS